MLTRDLTLLALGLAAAPWPAHGQNLEREIRPAVDRYVRVLNQGDPAALAALYVNDPRVGSLGDGDIVRGWSDVATLLEGIYQDVDSIRMSVDSVTVMPLGPDAAVAFFRYRWVTGGDPPGRATGAMTIVFRRTNGRWWVVHDHTSTLPAGEDAALPAPSATTGEPNGPVRQTTACVVTRITDGDTIECRGIGPVRLIGMDTPEMNQGRVATLAVEGLQRMVTTGATVDLEMDVEPRDRYNRVLAYVWAGGRLVNWVMVRQGWAVVLTYPPNVQHVEAFEAAQQAARAEGVGLWAIDGFSCLPRDRRANRCD